MTPPLSPVDRQFSRLDERESLRERITEVLRGAVITGSLQPGELTSVPTLAERFGVSATPVREAMLDLVKEGLAEPVRNKGFRITAPTDEQLDQMTELRLLIEVPTCARIAERYTPVWDGVLATLEETAREIVAFAGRGDLIAYVEADRRFHLGLLTLAGNAELVEVVGQLRARSRLFGLTGLVEKGLLTQSAAEHLTLLHLVRAGHAEGAAELMRRHIAHVRGEWAGRSERDGRED